MTRIINIYVSYSYISYSNKIAYLNCSVGEECDCGVDEAHCKERGEFDSCHPKNADQKLGCTLNKKSDPSLQCSYPSSGPCCNQQNRFVPES